LEATPPRRQLLIQIDGLSKPVLERALSRGALPELARLARGPGAAVVPVFSGLPSTTPAAQGELFYGVRCAVPAFAFLEGRRVARHMIEPASAGRVQRRLERDPQGDQIQGERGQGQQPGRADGHDDRQAPGRVGLLAGGSSYCNIYTGGASVARFCPAALAEDARAHPRGVAYRLRVLASYAGVAVRSGVMLAGELARQSLAHSRWRGWRGPRSSGGSPWARAKDAWTRIVLTVVLRDSARLAADHDLRRGLPVVHANFLGYDKQAHRYGPDSRPALRALKGIDRAIGSLARTCRAHAGPGATIVVYSDHGQEATTPIHRAQGRPITRIVRDAVRYATPDATPDTAPDTAPNTAPDTDPTGAPERQRDAHAAGAVRHSLIERLGEQLLGVDAAHSRDDAGNAVTTVESGPIAHVYLGAGANSARRVEVARRVARAARGVAVVITPGRGGDDGGNAGPAASAFLGERGPMPLERLCAEHLVAHPFAESVAPALAELAGHRDAGELILLGAGFTQSPVTFAEELGSHGGPGPRETCAFAILPERLATAAHAAASEGADSADSAAPIRFAHLRAALLADRGLPA